MATQQTKFFFGAFIFLFPLGFAHAGTILSPHLYAWSNNAGYINFANVTVNNGALRGYAWSANKGFIKFDPVAGGVLNDGAGNLSGFAWGEGVGWIDFGNVSIDGNGRFSGTASGALIGTLTFDCPNYCNVETDWRPAVVSSVSPAFPLAANSNGTGTPLVAQNEIPEQTFTAKNPPRVVPATTETGGATSFSATVPSSAPSPPVLLRENPALFDVISEPAKARVDTSSAGLVVKVAPGELLPISVKLANFGGGKRVDVLVKYLIVTSGGEEIYSTSETVAVETTANFVKNIQIPFDTPPGRYIVKTSIIYDGQVVPATTEFPFIVERRILGLFRSEFFLYGWVALMVSIFAGLCGYSLTKRRRATRYEPFDYSDQSKDNRIYYEIVSDTIGQMRQQAGDRALEVAAHTPGLIIDEKTGRVLAITESPSKVVANLVSGYEKSLGKKVSFSLRKN